MICGIGSLQSSYRQEIFGNSFGALTGIVLLGRRGSYWKGALVRVLGCLLIKLVLVTILICDLVDLGENWFWLPPEIGRKWPENGFWPHRENREKIAGKKEKSPENGIFANFRAFFAFLAIFPDFPGEAKIHFRAIFFRFQAEARSRFLPGRQDRKSKYYLW